MTDERPERDDDRRSGETSDMIEEVRRELERRASGGAAAEAGEDLPGEAAELGALWERLGALPEEEPPSERLRARFYAALAREEAAPPPHGRRARRVDRAHRRWRAGWRGWPARPAFQLALAAAALAAGVWIGARLATPVGEVRELRAEVRSMSRLVALSLLDHPSASERLRAVSWSQRVEADQDVAAALLDALERDPSVNVRLAAVDALARMADSPAVGSALVESLPRQPSPLVQLALGEALLVRDDPRLRARLREVAASDELHPEVRARLAHGLGDTA